MSEKLNDAKWAKECLEELLYHTELLLSCKGEGTGAAELIKGTAELKNELKTANRSRKFRAREMPTDGPGRFLASAIQKASADFRMRADTNPAKDEWARTLDELRFYFLDYIGRIRKECPEVE